MNPQTLLYEIVAEIETFAEMPDHYFTAESSPPYVVAMYTSGVPYRPAVWLGGPLSASRRMAASRAMRILERARLVRRITQATRNRVTHVRPTPRGLVVVVDLATKADPSAIVEGLSRTLWGPPLIRSFLRLLKS